MFRYKQLLLPAEHYGRKRGLYTGVGNGFNWVLTYSLNAIGLSYGSRLILNDFYKPADERNYTFGIIFSVSIKLSYGHRFFISIFIKIIIKSAK